MSSYDSCPSCGRTTADKFSSNWFPIHTCRECCDDDDETQCPNCGSTSYSDYDKVYAE